MKFLKKISGLPVWLSLLFPLQIFARQADEDPYAGGPVKELPWYETAFFWAALVFVLGLMLLFLRRTSRRPSRKFMERKKGE